MALADSLQQRDQAEEAVTFYQQVLDFDPGNLRVLNKLAHCHLQEDRKERAAEVYRQIVETYVERGITSKAIESCKKGLQDVPHDATLRERLADLLLEKGALEEARDEYQNLLQYQPGDLRITTTISQLNKKI